MHENAMSLLIVLADCETLLFAADTRASLSQGGHLPNPESKIFVRHRCGTPFLIGVGGEKEFSGVPVVDIVESCFARGTPDLDVLCATLKAAWMHDIDNDDMTSDELLVYENRANLSLFMAIAPNHPVLRIDGNWLNLQASWKTEFPQVAGSQSMQQLAGSHELLSYTGWKTYISKMFIAAAENEKTVGFPVEVWSWKVGHFPEFVKLTSAHEIVEWASQR